MISSVNRSTLLPTELQPKKAPMSKVVALALLTLLAIPLVTAANPLTDRNVAVQDKNVVIKNVPPNGAFVLSPNSYVVADDENNLVQRDANEAGEDASLGNFAATLPPAVALPKDNAVEEMHKLYVTGLKYEEGTGVKADLRRAVQWYQRAAKQGYAPAQFTMGTFYSLGKGVTKNLNEATKYFEKAAMQGYNLATVNLAMMAEIYDKDFDKAIQWHLEAVKQNIPASLYEIGRLYFMRVQTKSPDGLIISNNEMTQKAMEYLERAEKSGVALDYYNPDSSDAPTLKELLGATYTQMATSYQSISLIEKNEKSEELFNHSWKYFDKAVGKDDPTAKVLLAKWSLEDISEAKAILAKWGLGGESKAREIIAKWNQENGQNIVPGREVF